MQTTTTEKLVIGIKLPIYQLNLCALSKHEAEDTAGIKLEFILLQRFGNHAGLMAPSIDGNGNLHYKHFPIDFDIEKHLKFKKSDGVEPEKIDIFYWYNGEQAFERYKEPKPIAILELPVPITTWKQVLQLILADFSLDKPAMLRFINLCNQEKVDWQQTKIGFEISRDKTKIILYKL